MHPTDFRHLRLEPSPLERFGSWLNVPVFWAAVCAFLFVGGGLFYPHLRRLEWLQGGLLLLATLAAAMALARRLPVQNVIGISVLAALIGGGAHAAAALTGIPFGPYVYSQDMGRPLFGALPWPLPFIWILFLLTSRGTAQLVLRPWRRTRNYGFLLIGLTCALIVLLDVGLEVFATRVFSYWKWSETKLHLDLFGVPIVNFVAWGMVSLLILAFTTPFFINKKPGPPPPSDLRPLVLWGLISLLFAAGAMSKGFRAASTFAGVQVVLVTGLAVLGYARKPR